MGIAEQQREEARMYREMVPHIIDSIAKGEEPVDASARLADEWDMDRTLVYKWFQLTEADVERFKKRYALQHIIPLWIAVIAIAGIIIATIWGSVSLAEGWAVWVLVILVCGTGALIIRLFGLKNRAYMHRLQQLVADESEE